MRGGAKTLRISKRGARCGKSLFVALWVLGASCGLGIDGARGTPYDEERSCWDEDVSRGFSIEPQGGCTEAIEILRAPNGRIWRFTNGCVPQDFDELPSSQKAGLYDAPPCP